MSDKPIITDEEYAREVKAHLDYLNWVFGISTLFLSIACLQFKTPWHAAVICLIAVVPMYIHAFVNFPTSLKTLRKLYKETNSAEIKKILDHLERKYHGFKAIYSTATLWLSLFLYLFVLFSFVPGFSPFLTWIQT